MNVVARIQHELSAHLPTRSLQIANIFKFIASILVGVGLVRLGVSQYDVGRIEYVLFITYFLSAFWHLGLKDSLLSIFHDIDVDDRRVLYASIWQLHLLAAGIMASVGCGLFSYGIDLGISLNGLWPYRWLILIYALLLIITAPLDYFLFLRERYKSIIWVNGLWLMAHVGVILWAMNVRQDIVYVLYGLIGIMSVKGVYLLYHMSDSPLLHMKWSWYRRISRYSIPLILQALIGVGMQLVDSWLVSYYFDTETFAVFRFGAKEIPFSILLVTGLVAASIPAYKKEPIAAMKHMRSEFSKMLHLLFPIGMILIILSPYLYRWIYGAAYQHSADIFNIYVLLLLSRLLLPHVILYGHNKNWVLTGTIVVEVMINIGLSLWFIQLFGLVGVAYATVIAYLFQKVVLLLYAEYYLKVPSRQYVNWPLFLIYVLALLTVYVFSSYLTGPAWM